MRIRRIVLALIAALTVGASTVPAAGYATQPAQVACLHARIGGKSKCLQRGEYCAPRYEHQYKHYGFKCTKRDRNGRYHLESS